MKFYLSYNIGNTSYSKEFSSMYDLEDFLNKLCEVKQVDTIYLNNCEYTIKEELKQSIKGDKKE
jgi:hypothetical protein